MKTTRNNSMMAYVTLEDDTGSIEMLVFSNVISQYGSYLRENEPVVVTGRFSVRDDKDPQIVVNRARPMSDFAKGNFSEEERSVIEYGTLYLRAPNAEDERLNKVTAICGMFPGENSVVIYFADTGKRMGSRCALYRTMLAELQNVLGEENVVVK